MDTVETTGASAARRAAPPIRSREKIGTNDAQLADILARLAAAERELATRRDRAPRRRGHARWLAMGMLALLLALTPLSLLAASFQDLNPGSAHNANINAIADAGITKGCTDAQHYCPNEFVTREQMASFLARTAGLGGNPPVANAATLGGRGATTFARVARDTSGYDTLADPPQAFRLPDGIVYPTFTPMTGAAVTVQAPADGFVLVSAAVMEAHRSQNFALIRLRDITPGAPATAVSRTIYQLGNNDKAGASVTNTLALTWVFPVSGAGAKTFALEVSHSGGGAFNDTEFYNDILTALYVPFGHDGGTSLAP